MNESFLTPLARTVPETDWAIVIACVAAGIYISSRLLFPRYHSRILHAFFNRYEANKLIEEKNMLFSRGGLLLNLIPVLCIAVIVYQQIGYFTPTYLLEPPLRNYLWIATIVLIYFGGRILVIVLFGFAFQQKEIALRFNQVYLLQFENLGSFILIPSLMLPFTAGTVHLVNLLAIWILLVLWLFYTIIRELELLKSFRISIFYMFLYLCTLEILPLWWAIQSITEGW